MHCNREEGDGRVEDVVTTSKRVASGREKVKRSAWDREFAMASCLTERKLEEASSPLIILATPSQTIRCRIIVSKNRSSWLRMTFRITLHVSVTHAVLSRQVRV